MKQKDYFHALRERLGSLPRPPSRGLIEATYRYCPVCSVYPILFPGHRAGASLKPPPMGETGEPTSDSSPATEPGPH